MLIGAHLDRDAWQARLDACVLTDAQWQARQQGTDPSAWQEFADPFPQWSETFDHVSDVDDPPGNTPGLPAFASQSM